MIGQVKVVGILMIVQGALTSIMGIVFAALGPFIFAMMSLDKGHPPKADEKTVLTIVSVIYLILGILVLIVGILNIVAGIRCLRFRGRTLAIVALFSNIVSAVTCYCAPTSIALMVYGLIVLFNGEVAEGFQLAAEGKDPESVLGRRRRRLRDWEEGEPPEPDDRDFEGRYS